MRRAGLDYHEYAGIFLYDNWLDFTTQIAAQRSTPPRLFGISTKGSGYYSEVNYARDDFLVFGPETRGLPQTIREELGAERLLRIPMQADSRSLNLSNAAAVVVYEAWRQLGFIASDASSIE